MKSIQKFLHTVPLLGAVFLVGCGEEKEEEFPPYDNTDEVEAFFKENSEKFVFATIDELPKDLVWDDGADLPDIGSPDAKKGGTLYRMLPDFPRTLRIVGPDATGGIRRYLWDNTAPQFVEKHPNVDGYYPGLAEEWAIDKENNRVFMKLNPEARWSDGEEVTTEDVAFMFYYLTSKHTVAPFYQEFYSTKYTRLTVYDDHTFSITVADRRPDFATLALYLRPVARHFHIEHGPDYVERYQWRFAPTTGPYVLHPEDVKKGRSITFTRDDNWWAKDKKFWRNRYNPDKVNLKVVRDTDKAFEGFLAGEFDYFRLNLAKYWYDSIPDDHSLVQKGYIKKATFYNDIPRGSLGLWINTSRPILDDVHVRRGIHHASNWKLVIDKFFRGDWQRLNTSSDGYGDASSDDIKPREFSVEKAQEEFAKAGFTKRGPDGILTNDKGQRLSFNLSAGSAAYGDLLSILKQEALKAGLEYNIEILDATAAYKKAQEKKHEIAFTGTASSPTEVYPRYWDFWQSDNAYREDGSPKPQTNNFSVVSLPEIDELVDRYDKSEDHEEKIDLGFQMEEILYDHAPWVPGVDMQFYRVGYWRWVEWPEDFNTKLSEIEDTVWVHWIDPAKREETLQAMKDGKTFEPEVKVYDQFKK